MKFITNIIDAIRSRLIKRNEQKDDERFNAGYNYAVDLLNKNGRAGVPMLECMAATADIFGGNRSFDNGIKKAVSEFNQSNPNRRT